MDSLPRIPTWLAGVVLALTAVSVGVALWFLSPATDREYSFALLTVALIAAVLSTAQFLRSEVHQSRASAQLAQVASLLEVRPALHVGFAVTENKEPVTRLEVEVDWSEGDQPAIKTHADTAAALVLRKDPARDLTPVQVRVSNTQGRDPAKQVICFLTLPEGCEAYADSELDPFDLSGRNPRSENPGDALIAGRSRASLRFYWDTVTNGTWVTSEIVWLRFSRSLKGAVSVGCRLTAESVAPQILQLQIVIKSKGS